MRLLPAAIAAVAGLALAASPVALAAEPHPDLPEALRALARTKKARFAGAWGGYALRGAGAVLALSPDGERAAGAGPGTPLRLWDLESGRQTRLLALQDGVSAAAFAPDGKRVASGGQDGTITVWDAETGRAVKVLRRHQGEVGALAFSPDGKRLASGGEDGTVRVWSAATGRGLILHGHSDQVRSLTWFPDGSRLASAGDDGTVRVWDLAKGRSLSVVGAPDGPECVAVAVSPDGEQLLVGREGEGVVRLQVATGEEKLLGAAARVLSVAYSEDGSRALAVVSTAREVRLASAREAGPARLEIWGWQADTSEALSTVSGADGGSLAAAFSADGARVLTSGGGLVVWDVEGETAVRRTLGHTARIEALAVSRDGRLALSAADDGTARLWEAFSGKELFVFAGSSRTVRAVAFSSDGARALVGDALGQMRLYDAARGTSVGFVGPHRGMLAAAFADGDKSVVSTSLERSVVWDPSTGKDVASNWYPRLCTAVALSADGRLVLTADLVDGPVLREAATGRVLKALKRPGRLARAVALSRDGALAALVTSPAQGEGSDALEVWDAAAGRLLHAGRAASGLRVLSFSDDAKVLLAAAGDGSARLVSVRSLKETDRVDLAANGEQPTAGLFAPDGLSFLLGTSSGALQHYLIVADPAK